MSNRDLFINLKERTTGKNIKVCLTVSNSMVYDSPPPLLLLQPPSPPSPFPSIPPPLFPTSVLYVHLPWIRMSNKERCISLKEKIIERNIKVCLSNSSLPPLPSRSFFPSPPSPLPRLFISLESLLESSLRTFTMDTEEQQGSVYQFEGEDYREKHKGEY